MSTTDAHLFGYVPTPVAVKGPAFLEHAWTLHREGFPVTHCALFANAHGVEGRIYFGDDVDDLYCSRLLRNIDNARLWAAAQQRARQKGGA